MRQNHKKTLWYLILTLGMLGWCAFAQICISGQNRYPIVGLEWYLILSNGTLDWHGVLLLDGSYWLEYGMVLRLFILGSWLLMVAAGCCYGYAHRLMDGLDCCWCCVASVAALHAVCLQWVVAWYPLVVWSCGSVSGRWLLFFLLSFGGVDHLLHVTMACLSSRIMISSCQCQGLCP